MIFVIQRSTQLAEWRVTHLSMGFFAGMYIVRFISFPDLDKPASVSSKNYLYGKLLVWW